MALHERGALERYGVELLGAGIDALRVGEDRELFEQAMEEVGLHVLKSGYAGSLEEALEIAGRLGYPIIVRPSFTLGGEGGGVAYNRHELEEIVAAALAASPSHQVLLEESVLGWKEFELEVMRDTADNAIVVCSVENVDAMGVHTGDSITCAPQLTLSDPEYQAMRDDAFRVIRRVGVATGGSNIQFGVDPETGERVVIEMNPRVSRSSALASKATGFPIAKIAALLAVGYTPRRDPQRHHRQDLRRASSRRSTTRVVKIPRWAFEKFPDTPTTLGTSMKSVGEVMAIGSTFHEALRKALPRSSSTATLASREAQEPTRCGSGSASPTPSWERLLAVISALRQGWTVAEVAAADHDRSLVLARDPERRRNSRTRCGCWDVKSVPDLVLRRGQGGRARRCAARSVDGLRRARRWPPSGSELGIRRVYKRVDTCAAEFPASTPYLYSTWGTEDEAEPDATAAR